MKSPKLFSFSPPRLAKHHFFFTFTLTTVLILLLLVPESQCKVKKIKAVAKLIKAKMILKPLMKTGIIKLPTVHFVIPFGSGGLSNLFGGSSSTKSSSSDGDGNGNGNGKGHKVKCTPSSLFSSFTSKNSGNNLFSRIPSIVCGMASSSSGGSSGSNSFNLPQLNLGSLSRLNLGGLLNAMNSGGNGGGSNDCPPPVCYRPPVKKDCRQPRPYHPPPPQMLPPSPASTAQMISQNQESANWRPIYSPVAGQHPPMIMSASPPPVQTNSNTDMSMADFGNFSMEEYFNMITGNTKSSRQTPPPPSPPPLSNSEPHLGGFGENPRVHGWSADQTGQSFGHHRSPPQHQHHYQQHYHHHQHPQQVHEEQQQQIEQTKFDEEDEDNIIHQQQQTNISEEDEFQQRPIQQQQSQFSY